jgi:uncharacterized protein (DUF488 family)
MERSIYTIGHGRRSAEEFASLLHRHGISSVVDVRTYPWSSRTPWANAEPLRSWLMEQRINYHHLPSLGGHRYSSDHIPFSLWNGPWARSYAEHMSTSDFRMGLWELVHHAAERPTVVLASEQDWRKCHRSLLADRLRADGWKVLHITDTGATPHQWTLSTFGYPPHLAQVAQPS